MTKRIIAIALVIYAVQAGLGIGVGLFAAWNTPEGAKALSTIKQLTWRH